MEPNATAIYIGFTIPSKRKSPAARSRSARHLGQRHQQKRVRLFINGELYELPTEGQYLVLPLTDNRANVTVNITDKDDTSGDSNSIPRILLELKPFVVLVRHSKLPEEYIVDGALRNVEWRRILKNRILAAKFSGGLRHRRGSESRSASSIHCERVPYVVDGPRTGTRIDVGRCNPKASCAKDRSSRAYTYSRVAWTDGVFCPYCVPKSWRSPPSRQKDSSTIEAFFKIVVDECTCTIAECNQPIRRVFARVDVI